MTPVVEEALRQFPVVVLTGARQTGKSTLAQHLPSAGDRVYRTLDDFDVLDRAERSPEALVEDGDRLTPDEVPIEVKSSVRVRLEDCRGLELFLDQHPRTARVGLLLYCGTEVARLTPRVVAAPVVIAL